MFVIELKLLLIHPIGFILALDKVDGINNISILIDRYLLQLNVKSVDEIQSGVAIVFGME